MQELLDLGAEIAESHLDVFMKCLDDANAGVRRFALTSANEFKAFKVVPWSVKIAKRLTDDDVSVRRMAAKTLRTLFVEVPPGRGAPSCVSLHQDQRDHILQYVACAALSDIDKCVKTVCIQILNKWKVAT